MTKQSHSSTPPSAWKIRTPKQRVLKKHPKAYAKEGLMSGDWYIYIPRGRGHIPIAKELNAKAAWAAAATAEGV